MASESRERLIALLALTQSAALIDHVAATGTVDKQAMDHLLDYLLCMGARAGEDPSRDVFTDPGQYRIGKRALLDILERELPENQVNVPACMRAIVKLEKKLAGQPDLQARMARRLKQVRHLRQHFATEPASVYSAVGGAYSDILSPLKRPIPVTGGLRQIASRRNGDIIRTAILGGVQAAAVWRERDGRLWHLRLQRKKLLRALDELEGAEL